MAITENSKAYHEKMFPNCKLRFLVNIIPLGSHQFPAWEPPASFFLESHPGHKI